MSDDGVVGVVLNSCSLAWDNGDWDASNPCWLVEVSSMSPGEDG